MATKFVHPPQMETEMDSIVNKFDHDHQMVNKMDSVIAIKFDHCPRMETKKRGKDKPPSTCFVHPQGSATF